MTPAEITNKFSAEIAALEAILKKNPRVLITAPGLADGDSVGSQLALRMMIQQKYPKCSVSIVNDEPLQDRYLFLPQVDSVLTPEKLDEKGVEPVFDLGILVDGGIDRAGRVGPWFDACETTLFIDHHVVSADYDYTLRMVDGNASSTTEIIYYLSQLPLFSTEVDSDFAQVIYLGLIFDTGFFRHSNTSPEAMELGAKLLRTGFDFTRVGERGMLERTYASLQLLSDTLARATVSDDGKVIWSTLSQEKMKEHEAEIDDREGIIDQLFLTHGIQVAALFFDLGNNQTKVSLRSHGSFNVAKFARSLTKHGGGHRKAAGANFDVPMKQAVELVLSRLSESLSGKASQSST